MKLKYTLDDIAAITKGKLVGKGDVFIDEIFIDSRIQLPQSGLFVALRGPNHDGHDFLVELVNKGQTCFIVESDLDLPGVCYVKVNDGLKALQSIAAHHRSKFNYPVVAITGSNGKTIVKEWLYYLLRDDFNIVRSPKSYNSQVGVALSLLLLDERNDLALIEAGISKPGEMEVLCDMIRPTHGVLTNIREAHLENFRDENELRREKLKLFKGINYSEFPHVSKWKTEIYGSEVGIIFRSSSDACLYNFPFTDKASIENFLVCLSFISTLNISVINVVKNAKYLPAIAMRMEVKKGKGNSVLLDDSYNSDLAGLKMALEYQRNIASGKKKVLILSDILRDRINLKILYGEVLELIQLFNLDLIVGVGKEIGCMAGALDNFRNYMDVSEFIDDFDLTEISESCVLVKGARKFHFEKISGFLEEKTHQTVLEINLANLVHNVNKYRQLLPKSTMLLAMIKAFGYGAGSIELAKVLVHNGVQYLAVAFTDEAVELRKAGIKSPILVMNAEDTTYEDVVNYNLQVVVFSEMQLDDFVRFLISKEIKGFPVFIKLDTGMNRLGFKPSEVDNILNCVQAQPEVEIIGLLSHLATADRIADDNFTIGQLNLFEEMCVNIESRLNRKVIKSILNSAGIERFPKFSFDMARLGIGMYGESVHMKELRSVVALKSRVSQVKEIIPGESIGYGRICTEGVSKIAIIPVGYADGYRRALGNGKGRVYINGTMCKTVGNICMDMLIVDISNLEVNVGTEVELFGAHITLKELADQLDTISYEILAAIPSRVVRKYVNN